MADPADVARLLELSDERDQWLRARLAWARYAYERGHRAGWNEGYEAAHAEMSADWHAIADPASRRGESHAEYETRRWGPAGPEHFGDPRPGDLSGSEAVRRARQSWQPLGLPQPGMVYLGGQAVHGPHGCTAACRAYRAGWYSTAAAARILATLPGAGLRVAA